MCRLEEKIYEDQKRVNDFQRKSVSNFGEQKVSNVGQDSGGHSVIQISNDSDTVVRKVHNVPEYIRTQGG